MAEETKPVESDESTQSDPEGDDGSSKHLPTASEVEASWKHRVSQKDAAHAAEAKQLREQIASLTASSKDADTRTDADNDAIKAELATTKTKLRETEQRAVVDTRTLKFPQAAEALDAEVLAGMDEAKLAGLEARLVASSAAPTVPIDPSTPARDSGAAKPQSEKTSAELKADLEKYSSGFAAQLPTPRE